MIKAVFYKKNSGIEYNFRLKSVPKIGQVIENGGKRFEVVAITRGLTKEEGIEVEVEKL